MADAVPAVMAWAGAMTEVAVTIAEATVSESTSLRIKTLLGGSCDQLLLFVRAIQPHCISGGSFLNTVRLNSLWAPHSSDVHAPGCGGTVLSDLALTAACSRRRAAVPIRHG